MFSFQGFRVARKSMWLCFTKTHVFQKTYVSKKPNHLYCTKQNVCLREIVSYTNTLFLHFYLSFHTSKPANLFWPVRVFSVYRNTCICESTCFLTTETRVFVNLRVSLQQKHAVINHFGNSYNRYTSFDCHKIVPLSETRVFSTFFSCLSRMAGCLFHASHVFRWTRVRTETNIIGLWRVRGLLSPMFQCLIASFHIAKHARAATLCHMLLPSCWTTQDQTRQDKTTQHPTRLGHTLQDKTRQDKTRQDKTRQDTTSQDTRRQDKTRQSTLCHVNLMHHLFACLVLFMSF